MGASPSLDLLPTGAGEVRRIERPGVTFLDAAWLPDGARVLVRAREETRAPGLYVLDIGDGTLNAFMPEGIAVGPVWALSPDGAMVAIASDHGVELHPLRGGPPRTVRGLEAQDRLLAWIEDGLLVSDTPNPLALSKVFKVDPVTGARRIWREILPRDPAGIMMVRTLLVTPDGRSYAYGWHRALSDLYLVEGLG